LIDLPSAKAGVPTNAAVTAAPLARMNSRRFTIDLLGCRLWLHGAMAASSLEWKLVCQGADHLRATPRIWAIIGRDRQVRFGTGKLTSSWPAAGPPAPVGAALRGSGSFANTFAGQYRNKQDGIPFSVMRAPLSP
jgi:hypothetical protein